MRISSSFSVLTELFSFDSDSTIGASEPWLSLLTIRYSFLALLALRQGEVLLQCYRAMRGLGAARKQVLRSQRARGAIVFAHFKHVAGRRHIGHACDADRH